MKFIYDLKQANEIIEKFNAEKCQIWLFGITHRRMGLQLSKRNVYEVIYIISVSSAYIKGFFSWDNPKIEIVKNEEEGITIIDKNGNFELIADGGFGVVRGHMSEFGDSFDHFLLGEMEDGNMSD